MANGAAAPTVVEPDWLREQRDRAKRLEFELPTAKQKGWEFTDLSGLDLDGYTEAVARVDGLQAPDGAIVVPLAEAAAQHPELVRDRLGEIVPAERPVHGPQRVALARRRARLRPGRRPALESRCG